MAKKEFKIPEAFISSLTEFSAGGFILFTFDIEGNPVVNASFDDPHSAVAMQTHIRKWSEAIEDINLQITINGILNQGKTKKKS